jgi:methionyl-tRNA synthetase
VNTLLQTYLTHLDAIKLRLGLTTILHISALGNKFLQDNKLDNRLFSEEPERCATIIGMALNHLHLLASILSPYMPKTAESIFQQLGVDPVVHIPDIWDANALSPGHVIGEPKPLFTTIPASKLEEWSEAFGGAELRKQKILEAEKVAVKKAAKKKGKEEKLQRKRDIVLPLHTKQASKENGRVCS